MNRPYIILGTGVVVAVALVVCGWLIRDGLLAVSTEMRDNRARGLPEEVRLTLGESDAVVTLGEVSVEPSTRTNAGTLNLENVRIDFSATQPAK